MADFHRPPGTDHRRRQRHWRGLCQLIAERGGNVVVADRDLAAAEALVASLGGNDNLAARLDVADVAQVQALFTLLADQDRLPDILINSAGIREVEKPLDLAASEWNRVLSVNLSGTFYCCQAFARALRDQRPGRGDRQSRLDLVDPRLAQPDGLCLVKAWSCRTDEATGFRSGATGLPGECGGARRGAHPADRKLFSGSGTRRAAQGGLPAGPRR